MPFPMNDILGLCRQHPSFSYLRTEEGDLVRIHLDGRRSFIARLKPARRRSFAFTATGDTHPLQISYPNSLSATEAVSQLGNSAGSVLPIIDNLLRKHPQILSGITLPSEVKVGMCDHPIEVVRTEEPDGGEAVAAMRRENRLLWWGYFTDGTTRVYASNDLIVLNGKAEESGELTMLLRCYLRVLAERTFAKFIRALPFREVDRITEIETSDAAKTCASLSQPRCGGKARLRINWRAILLPTPLLTHLICHELAHLREMNHSSRFYDELKRLSPNSEAMERDIQRAWAKFPLWSAGRTPKF